MSRHVPTPEEQQAIDLLTLSGYAVVRQRTYDRLNERVRVADCMTAMEVERRESTERWAHRSFAEQRRISDRLNEVCFAAAVLGVPIEAINAALDAGRPPVLGELHKVLDEMTSAKPDTAEWSAHILRRISDLLEDKTGTTDTAPERS